MSYDLFFWREQPGTTLDPDVVGGLQDAEDLPGLIPISRDTVVAAFREQFPDVSVGDAELDWEGEGSYFQVGFTHFDERQVSIVAIYCGYELLKSPSAMRRLASVAASLGCRFHDAQQA